MPSITHFTVPSITQLNAKRYNREAAKQIGRLPMASLNAADSSDQVHLRFRGGLVFKAHRLCVSLNSRLESNTGEESAAQKFYTHTLLYPVYPNCVAFRPTRFTPKVPPSSSNNLVGSVRGVVRFRRWFRRSLWE